MIRTMCATGLACIVVFAPRAIAQDVPPTETPEAIAAVLQAKCLPCHGPETQKHGLRLET